LSIKAPGTLDFKEQVDFVLERYRETQKLLGLAPATAVFRRIFLSDILNQAAFVAESGLVEDSTATSIVQQPPLPGSKIELLAYHIDSPNSVTKRRVAPNHLLVENNGKRHLWSTRLCAGDGETSLSAAAQTRGVFGDLIDVLAKLGATLRDHCMRTWIYVKGVDVFYPAMADSRSELFAEQGLTDSTHYIASTGIEGSSSHGHDLVVMDAYSNLDLVPGQVSYLNDFERLCATKNYNITFERGTRIAYADRAHCFISGTASIDKAGEVVYPGDVMRQLERTLENIDALLRSGAATLADMMYLIVYLRDAADYVRVEAHLRNRFPDLPTVITQSAVCRPGWLVEAEGIAIIGNQEPALPLF
jgi:enamine deaminase RidA (YjgF/YER057c/UK114 family)